MGLSQIGLKVMGILSMGRIKANRTIFAKPLFVSGQITNTDRNKVVITFDQALDVVSIPATTAFVLAGKIISNVAIAGTDVTLTVTVSYDYGDAGITIDYTKPALNPIKASIGGGIADSFAAESVTNNILYPNLLLDGNTVAWFDGKDSTTITKDGSDLVSQWSDKLGSGHDLLQAGGTNQPTSTVDGVLFNDTIPGDYMKTAAFTYNQPSQIYLVLKHILWSQYDRILDGNASNSGGLMQDATTPGIKAGAGTFSAQNDGLVLDTLSIVRILFNGASSKLQVNENAATTGNFGASNMGGITMNDRGSPGGYNPRVLMVDAIFRNVADGANETIIYNYLKAKHSL